MMPVVMPPMAVGITTRTMVSHFGMPRARLASRSSFGTSLSISSVERTTVGIIRMVRARLPAKPVYGMSRTRIHTVRTKRPATIEGTPIITSTKKVTILASRLPPYSTRKTAVRTPIGAAITMVSPICSRVPISAW